MWLTLVFETVFAYVYIAANLSRYRRRFSTLNFGVLSYGLSVCTLSITWGSWNLI